MKLIALVTIEPGSVPPGGEFDIKDKAEAMSLVERGFAALPVKAPPAPAPAAATGVSAPAPTADGETDPAA